MSLRTLGRDLFSMLMEVIEGVSLLRLWATGDVVVQEMIRKSPNARFHFDVHCVAPWPKMQLPWFEHLTSLVVEYPVEMQRNAMRVSGIPKLPKTLKSLEFGFSDNFVPLPRWMVTDLPHLTKLNLYGRVGTSLQNLLPLPPTLVHFEFFETRDHITHKNIEALPKSLETLALHAIIEPPEGHAREILFPPNLTKLVFQTKRSLSVAHLPRQLAHLAIKFIYEKSGKDGIYWTPHLWRVLPTTLTFLEYSSRDRSGQPPEKIVPIPQPGDLPRGLQHFRYIEEPDFDVFDDGEESLPVSQFLAALPSLKTFKWPTSTRLFPLHFLHDSDSKAIPPTMERVHLENVQPSTVCALPPSVTRLAVSFSPRVFADTNREVLWPPRLTHLRLNSYEHLRLVSSSSGTSNTSEIDENSDRTYSNASSGAHLPRLQPLPRTLRTLKFTFVVETGKTLPLPADTFPQYLTRLKISINYFTVEMAKRLFHLSTLILNGNSDIGPTDPSAFHYDQDIAKYLSKHLRTLRISNVRCNRNFQIFLETLSSRTDMDLQQLHIDSGSILRYKSNLDSIRAEPDSIHEENIAKDWKNWPRTLRHLSFEPLYFDASCIIDLPRGLQVLILVPIFGVRLEKSTYRDFPVGLAKLTLKRTATSEPLQKHPKSQTYRDDHIRTAPS